MNARTMLAGTVAWMLVLGSISVAVAQTIVYDDFDLLAADIGDPSKLNLAFWNGSEWDDILPCSGCSIDTENRIVTVIIDHLTEFALVAPDEHFVYLPSVLK